MCSSDLLGAPGGDLRVPGGDLRVRLEGGAADLVACFGFFHHVPTTEARRRLLQELLSYTRTGALCCVSLWRPMSDRRIARRARESTRAGLRSLGLSEKELDKGDYLLGWQGRPDTWRYWPKTCRQYINDIVNMNILFIYSICIIYSISASTTSL